VQVRGELGDGVGLQQRQLRGQGKIERRPERGLDALRQFARAPAFWSKLAAIAKIGETFFNARRKVSSEGRNLSNKFGGKGFHLGFVEQ
jgi:hypothetical protein